MNRIEGRTAAGKDGMARFEGIADAGFMGGCGIGGNGPGAAMNEENGSVEGRSRHRSMVEHWGREDSASRAGVLFAVPVRVLVKEGRRGTGGNRLKGRDKMCRGELQGIWAGLVRLRTIQNEERRTEESE